MPSILTLYSEKYTKRRVYHLKDPIKEKDVFKMFSKRRLNSLGVFRHSVEKPHNSTQLVSSIVFESSYFIGSSEQNSETELNDILVWPSILCLI